MVLGKAPFCCCLVPKSGLLFATPWIAAHKASLSFTISQGLLKLKSFVLMVSSNHLILSLPSPPSAFNLSQDQGLFQ